MRNYHVTLTSGERNVRAKDMHIDAHGVLSFSNDNDVILAYAPGAWLSVEVERLDDKG
jgi:hypothetical protein